MRRASEPLRGVNLGGWFVLERWMTPSLFKGSSAKDELSLTRERGEHVILEHRKNFITEADFKWMKSDGIEIVRIPVGYWILEDQDSYVSSPEILDWCFKMAKKYKLKILLGLHAAPGSQNRADHSGNGSKAKPGWFNEVNQERTTEVLLQLAGRYASHPNLWGLSILNEPDSFSLVRYIKLRRWTAKVSKQLRAVLPETVRVLFSDAYMFSFWRRFNPRDTLDIHHYQCHGPRERSLPSFDAHMYWLISKWSNYRRLLRRRAYVVGEWSAVLPSNIKPSKKDRQQYIFSQMESFGGADAHFYWSYKTEGKGGWNYRSMVERGFKFRRTD